MVGLFPRPDLTIFIGYWDDKPNVGPQWGIFVILSKRQDKMVRLWTKGPRGCAFAPNIKRIELKPLFKPPIRLRLILQ